jgi:lysophospholipase L1-like esterase
VLRRLAPWSAVAGLLLTLGACTPAQPPDLSGSAGIGAMGDSISRAFDACSFLAECPAESWTTGSDPRVDSHYFRLLARNPAMAGRVYNAAKVGASSWDLPVQAAAIARSRPGYVTVAIGSNDACAPIEAAMTPRAVFRANIDTALAIVYRARPDTRVLVTSIPNLYRLWQVGHGNAVARWVWSAGFCRTMLDNPASLSGTDESRRQRVLAQVVAYNVQLAQACAAHPGCRYDGGAVFNDPFQLTDLSPFDYFHPNIAGQRKIAALTWAKSGL